MKWICDIPCGNTAGAVIFAATLIISPVFSEEIPDCVDYKEKEFCDAFQKIENWRAFESGADYAIIRSLSKNAPDEIRLFATFWLIMNVISLDSEFFQSENYYSVKRRLILQQSSYQHATNDNQRPQAYLLYLFEFLEPMSTLRIFDYEFNTGGFQFAEADLRYIECFVLNDLPFLKTDKITDSESFRRCLKS